MKSILISTAIVILFSSCFLFKDYRKKEFVYEKNGKEISFPIIVPKGYLRYEKTDTGGITLYSFHYADGALLYAAYLADTAYQLQTLNKVIHQPLIHRLGGLVYKGQDENELFYREIQQGNLRFGYRHVSMYVEPLFDSATNYASLQKR